MGATYQEKCEAPRPQNRISIVAFPEQAPKFTQWWIASPLRGCWSSSVGTPPHISACKVLTSGESLDRSVSDSEENIMKLRANWRNSSAQQLKRVSVGMCGGNVHLPTCVGGVSAKHGVWRPSDRAPHVPVAGTSVPVAGGSSSFTRHYCLACDGRFRRIFPFGSPLINGP